MRRHASGRPRAGGLSTAELARELYLTPATVETHGCCVLQRLDLRDRVQAVALTYETDLIEPGTG